MSTKELLLNTFGGLHEVAYFDETDRPGSFRTKTYQEMEPIIERAKALSELTPGREMRHAALIPLSVLDRSHREGWFHDKAKWRAWANDPDNAAFRTWPGRI